MFKEYSKKPQSPRNSLLPQQVWAIKFTEDNYQDLLDHWRSFGFHRIEIPGRADYLAVFNSYEDVYHVKEEDLDSFYEKVMRDSDYLLAFSFQDNYFCVLRKDFFTELYEVCRGGMT